MNRIICPKCGEVFSIDEMQYASIVKQVKDNEFKNEVKIIKDQYEKEKKDLLQITKLELEKEFDKELKAKETEIEKLKNNSEMAGKEYQLKEQSLKDQYEEKLRFKDEEIARYRDFKLKLSTKMIGESLERHCENEFNKLRATGFQTAYFEKDNDAKTGSKGDYIFRDKDLEGNEFISIMFEMKNEADATSSKKKNEDFLKELDKDRKEKNCEYAVLVSMLESESELYNAGIVDVSHKYPKMYVIRPQFFIPMITMLRNAASNSLGYRKELAEIRAQNRDVLNFENRINEFKEAFAKNYNTARKHFDAAIDEIDKTIVQLEKIKDALTASGNQLRLANDKAQKLSIKRLTKNNPTMEARFAEVRSAEVKSAGKMID